MKAESEEYEKVVGRLAPSPTGALHLGNARSFLLAWLSARQAGGAILLRIEDLDSPRVKHWAIRQTVEDLKWLGLDWDAANQDGSIYTASSATSTISSEDQFWLQSSRLKRYEEILMKLREQRQIYPCRCSRSDVAAAASAPHDDNFPELEGQIYPGTCRNLYWLTEPLPMRYSWRWRFQDRSYTFNDALHGRQHANPLKQLGDFVIARHEAAVLRPAYQLAVVVDDHDQLVNEIVRGDDLLFSTYRQIAILEHLDWPIPRYVHVPLMVGPDGRRLAKRHGDTRISHLRELGIQGTAVVGFLAATLGIIPHPQPISAGDLIGALDWSSIPKSATVFDLDKSLPLLKRMR